MPLLQAIFRYGRAFIEQRRSLRESVHFPAWIAGDADRQWHACTVLDVSDGGARIMMSSPTRVPKEFWLILARDGTRRRRCQIAWRSDDQLGVSYVGPLQAHPALH
jgi:PilZ domain